MMAFSPPGQFDPKDTGQDKRQELASNGPDQAHEIGKVGRDHCNQGTDADLGYAQEGSSGHWILLQIAYESHSPLVVVVVLCRRRHGS